VSQRRVATSAGLVSGLSEVLASTALVVQLRGFRLGGSGWPMEATSRRVILKSFDRRRRTLGARAGDRRVDASSAALLRP